VLVDLPGEGRIALKRQRRGDLVGAEVTLGIRPEHLLKGGGPFSMTITPKIIERLGIHTITYSTLASGGAFTGLFEGDPQLAEGVPFSVGIDPDKSHLFDASGKAVV
jgi:multiple sugar transport system ATP-binding protein